MSACFVLFSSLCMHLLAGGSLRANALVLAMVWAVSLSLCVGLATYRPSLLRISTVVGLFQPIYHWVFTAGFGASLAGHTHHSGHLQVELATLTPEPVPGSPANFLAADLPMLLAHGFAALVTVALMYRFESLITAISGWLYELFTARLPLGSNFSPLSVVRRNSHPMFDEKPIGWQQVCCNCLALRGPPSFVQYFSTFLNR